MSTKVNLTKRIVIEGRDRFVPVVQSANGRIKPDTVVVDGKELPYPGGRFYIDWTEKGQRRRRSAGKNGSQAVAQQLRKQTELRALEQGLTVVSEAQETTGLNLAGAVADYLADIKLAHKPKTIAAYTTSLTYFLESCQKPFVESIDRRDMIRFAAYVRDKKGAADRTVWNKFNNVMSFLKLHKKNTIVGKGDWPKFTEEDVEIYEEGELEPIYAVCTPEERLWWDFFLMTGMREQEVIYTTWRNVKFDAKVVQMRHKPEYNWKPKGYKEREIPVPDDLLKALEKVKKTNGLLFPTESGKPKMDFLHCLKAIARRAAQPEEYYYLHKFRATFATMHLQEGVDLRTVQSWCGHVDIESTMRYLRPARNEAVRDKVNATFA